jgi:hypothetical protein
MVSEIGHELAKDSSYQLGVETKHKIYCWKCISLPYTMSRFYFLCKIEI